MEIVFGGLVFLVVAFAANLAVLLPLITTRKEELDSKSRNQTIVTMLLNLPVAITYVWLAFKLMNTIRVEFINESGAELTNVEIIGCEELKIVELGVDESIVKWVNIHADCSIQVKYELHGQSVEQIVFGYATSGSGQAGTFRLGLDSLAIDERPGY